MPTLLTELPEAGDFGGAFNFGGVSNAVPERPNRSTVGTITSSLARGRDQLFGTGFALAGVIADTFGADQFAKSFMRDYTRKVAEAGLNPAEVGTFRNIEGAGDAFTYAVEGLFENVPNIALSAVGGGIGAAAAKGIAGRAIAAKLAEREVGAAAAKRFASVMLGRAAGTGAVVGGSVANVGQEVGSITGDIYERTGGFSPVESFTGGVLAGAVETVADAKWLKQAFGRSQAAKLEDTFKAKAGRVLGAGLKQTQIEGFTEAAQTVIEEASAWHAEHQPDKPFWTPHLRDAIVDSYLKSLLPGGVMGGGGQIMEEVWRKEQSSELRDAADRNEQLGNTRTAGVLRQQADEVEFVPATAADLQRPGTTTTTPAGATVVVNQETGGTEFAPVEQPKETIVFATVQPVRDGKAFEAPTHAQAFEAMQAEFPGIAPESVIAGFKTSTGRIVSREEAAAIAGIKQRSAESETIPLSPPAGAGVEPTGTAAPEPVAAPAVVDPSTGKPIVGKPTPQEDFAKLLAEQGVTAEEYAARSAITMDLVGMPEAFSRRVKIGPSEIAGDGVILTKPMSAGQLIVPALLLSQATTEYDASVSRTPAGRHINHADDANTSLVVQDGQAMLVAKRRLAPGEELTVNYREQAAAVEQLQGQVKKVQERIVATALRNPTTGEIISSPNKIHVQLWSDAGINPAKLKSAQIEEASGFLTSTGRFVGREEASRIGAAQGMIHPGGDLMGENVVGLKKTSQPAPQAKEAAASVDKPDAITGAVLPRELAGAKPRYSYGSKAFVTEFASDFDKAAFILSQTNPSARDADYAAWAVASSGMTEQEVRRIGREIRNTLIKPLAAAAVGGTTAKPAVLKIPAYAPPSSAPTGLGAGAASPRPVAASPRPVAGPETNAPAAGKAPATGRETVDPTNDPVVGVDINGTKIQQSSKGVFYTFENGRVRTSPSFAEPAAAPTPAPAPLQTLRDNVTGAIERGEKEPVVGKPAPAPAPSTAKLDDIKARRAELQRKLREKLKQVGSAPDPEILTLAAQLAASYAEEGVVKFADFASRVKADMGDVWQQLQRYLHAAWQGAGADNPSLEDVTRADATRHMAEVDSNAAKEKVTSDESGTGESGGLRRAGGQPGQPVAGASDVDAGPPTGPVPPVAPAAEAGPVVRPELSAGTGTGGSAPVQGSGQGNRVGSGAVGDSSAGTSRSGTGQPADTSGAPADAAQRVAAQNHVLPAGEDWIPSGAKAKANANLAAVRLLKRLEAEKRNPTPEEKAVLAKYVGWGGLKPLFDTGKEAYRTRPPWNGEQQREYDAWEKQWGKLYDEVKAELTPDEWDTARASILNAHYTSRTVINGLWQAVQRLGFKGGNVLETSAGIGHFIGLQPAALRDTSRWQAVELDTVSGRILGKLYPQAAVQVTGFQDARIPVNSVDLIVGNVPFAKDGPTDKRYPNLSLHNYFFARGLDLLKPGGLMVAITSDSTMDGNASQKAREFFAERADFVGAIRLPNTAFKENAGTEVTTDILIFRKRDGTPFAGQPFVNTAEAATYKGEPIEINEYFAAHPEMMLGRMSKEGTMYGGDMNALLPTPGAELSQQLTDAVAKLPQDAFGAQATPDQQRAPAQSTTFKPGSLVMQDGKPYMANADGSLTTPDWADSPGAVKQAKAYIGVRDATRALIVKQLDPDATPEAIEALRMELNRAYDAYVKQHGAMNKKGSAFLDEDVDFPLATALEDDITAMVESVVEKGKNKGKKVVKRTVDFFKSKIFTERTLFPRQAPTSAASVEDGYYVSLNFRGRVDVDYIAELTGQDVESVKAGLVSRGLAFEDPATGQIVPRWQYLSGNVKKKLRVAQAAVEGNPAYAVNVAELEKVLPPAIPIQQISVRLGSTWVPPKVIERFLAEKLGVQATVLFTPQTGSWHVDAKSGMRDALNATTYGIHGWGGHELAATSLNLKSATVTRPVTRVSAETGKSREVEEKDPAKTLEAQEKQDRVKRMFVEWVKQTPSAATELERLYNELKNHTVKPVFDPPTWDHYPGASTDIVLRDHQKRVATRMVLNSTLLAHAVGTGKTYAITTAAMEQRRLGLARKPMIVVQNATLEQFARSAKRLYPTARILAPNAKQRDAKQRNRTMSRIATGDWDIVLVPQSFFNMLPDDPERERAYIRNEIKEMEAAKIEAAASGGKKSPKAADLQRAIDRLKDRLTNLAARKVDDVLTFEQLGVDSLFVDEAHEYKKLQFTTKMESIKGLDLSVSKRGFSMMMKARWVQEKNQGRNVTFATGTPVSNTIAEAWTMMRYLRPDVLKDYDMEKFDSFAGTFGETVTQLEMTAGGTWKPVTRFAKYTNGPELIAAWRTVADVVTPEEINLPNLPALKNGKTESVVVKQSPALKAYVLELRQRLDEFAAMSGKDKRENSHIPVVVFTHAKKASLDMRMIDPSHPDEPGSKLNRAADEVLRIWQESADVQGAQMVFADLYQNDPDNPQFNLYDEMKRKLVARGIPEDQIAILTADIKDAKREALFQKVNDGEIRVAIGSTGRMGTGINAQRKLVGLHHLDAPMRPMDIEQRNGRILRQGNENPVVEVLQYGVENTLDAAMFQKLATKQRFINQILRGDLQGRNFEDSANETSLTFEEQMAAFSGDPMAMERVSVDNQVRQLSSLQSGHYEQVRKGREELDYLTSRKIPTLKTELTAARSASLRFEQAFASGDFTVQVGDTKAEGRKEVVAALDVEIAARIKDMNESAAAAITGGKRYGGMASDARWLVLNGQDVRYKATTWISESHVQDEKGRVLKDESGNAVTKSVVEAPVVEWQFVGHGGTHKVTSGQGLLQGVPSELLNITKTIPENIAASLAKAERDQTELAGFVQQPFDREAELLKAKTRLSEIDSILAAKGKPAVGAEPWLLDVPKSEKPLAAQRTQIRRILDDMEQLERESKDWDAPTIKYSRDLHAKLTKRLAVIEKEMLGSIAPTTDAAIAIIELLERKLGEKLYSDPLLLTPLAKLALQIAKALLRAGRTLEVAIREAIAQAKAQMPGEVVDEAQLATAMTEGVFAQAPEPGPAVQSTGESKVSASMEEFTPETLYRTETEAGRNEAAAQFIDQTHGGDLRAAYQAIALATPLGLPDSLRIIIAKEIAARATKDAIAGNDAALFDLAESALVIAKGTGSAAGQTLQATHQAIKELAAEDSVVTFWKANNGLIDRLLAAKFPDVTSSNIKAWLAASGREAVKAVAELMTKTNNVTARVLRIVGRDAGVDWASLFTSSAVNQRQWQQDLFAKIREHPKLQHLQEKEQVELTNLLAEAWQRERMKVFRREFKKNVALPDVRVADMAELEAALPELVKQLNLGLLANEAFRNAVAPRYGQRPVTMADAKALFDLAQAAQAKPEGFQRSRAFRGVYDEMRRRSGVKAWEFLQGWWYASVLSGFGTQGRNILGNASILTENLVASVARNPRSAGALVSAMWRGMRENALGGEFQAIMAGDVTARPGMDIKDAANALELAKDSPEAWKRVLSTGRYVTRFMLACDSFFYDAASEVSAINSIVAQNQGVDWSTVDAKIFEQLNLAPAKRTAAEAKARAERLTGTDLSRRVVEILEQGRPSEVRDAQHRFALEATLNNEPEGLLGMAAKTLIAMREKVPALAAVVPFVRISANVGNLLLQHSPLGLYWVLRNWRTTGNAEWTRQAVGIRENMSVEEYQQLRAKVLLSHAALAMVFAWAASGADEDEPWFQVTGSMQGIDPDKRRQLEQQGIRPYSVKFGDRSFDYRQTPWAFGWASVGQVMDAHRYDPKWDEQGMAVKLATGLAGGKAVILDQSFLSNLMLLLERGPQMAKDQNANKYLAFLGRTAGGVIPTLVKEGDSWMSPEIRKPQGAWDYLLREVPIARRSVGTPVVNVLGEPVERPRYPWSWLTSEASNDPVWQALGEKAQKGVFLPVPSAAATVLANGKRVKMTPEQFAKYQSEVGKLYREKLTRDLSRFERMTPEQASAYFKREFEPLREQARTRVR